MTPEQWQRLAPWLVIEVGLLGLTLGFGMALFEGWRWRRSNRLRCAEQDRIADMADARDSGAGLPIRPRAPRNRDEVGNPIPEPRERNGGG